MQNHRCNRGGIVGVVAVIIANWMTLGLSLAAALLSDWVTVTWTLILTGATETASKTGPFYSCTADSTTFSLSCSYVGQSNFLASSSDLCPSGASASVSTCGSSANELSATRIILIVAVVLQFVSAIIFSVVPCRCVERARQQSGAFLKTKCTRNVITYNKARIIYFIAACCSVVVAVLWYFIFQHVHNVDNFISGNVEKDRTRSDALSFAFMIMCVGAGVPWVVLSLSLCCCNVDPSGGLNKDDERQREGVNMAASSSSFAV